MHSDGTWQLVGRRTELARVDEALERTRSGHRTVVLLTGPAGIGKTALAAAVRDRASDARLVTVTVTESETFIGWAVVATLLDRLADIADRRPEWQRDLLRRATGAAAGDAVEPLAIAAAVSDVLRDAAESTPLVLIVDDAHWVDASSAGALSFAIRLLDRVPILLVVAARPEPTHLDARRIVPAGDLVEIEPTALSVAGVRQLLADEFGLEIGRFDLVQLHAATGGNPLYVVESARALQRGASLEEALLPASLGEMVERSLAGVPPAHLDVLSIASLMPEPTLARLTAATGSELARAALGEAEAADLVRVEQDRVAFRHPLVRAGLARRLGTLGARAAHQRLAGLSEDPAVRAVHLAAGTVDPDPEVAGELEEAAAAAASRGMLVEAAHLARRSAELTDAVDLDRRRRRLWLAADAALDAGAPRGALELLLPIIDDLDPGELLHSVLAVIAVAVAELEGVDAAIPWIRRQLDAADDDRRRTSALITLTRAVMFVDMRAALTVADEALEAAIRCGDRIETAASLSTAARVLLGQECDLTPLHEQAREAVARSAPLPQSALGEVLIWCDELELASEVHLAASRVHERSGQLRALHDDLTQLVEALVRLGRLTAAREALERSLTIAMAADYQVATASRLADLAVIDALQGEPIEGTMSRIERSTDIPLAPADAMYLDATTGLAHLLVGDAVAAAADLRRAHHAATSIGYLDLGALAYHANLIEALIAIGAVDEAVDVLAQMRTTASRNRRPRTAAELGRAEALIMAAEGDLDAAAAAIDRSLDAHAELTLPIERGRALLLAGAIARRRKQRGAARSHVEQAELIFRQTDAHALRAHAEAESARLGGRLHGELTGSELRIAELAAAGSTNDEIAAALFVSRRTVESNLTRIYRKLGVRSRTELAGRLR